MFARQTSVSTSVVSAVHVEPRDRTTVRERRRRTFSNRQALILGGVHLAALFALWVPTPAGAMTLLATYLLTGLGISLGYHRGLSHGAFRAQPWAMRGLSLLGALALQGGPIGWVGFHRAHHRFADNHGDPHAASRGFFWSHVGWALHKAPNGLERDPFLVWLEKCHLLLNLGLFVIAFVLFGAKLALWAFPLRIALLWHATWLTNSIAHGVHCGVPKPRNVHWLAIVGFGEGLHANHHDAPSHASFVRNPGEVDPGYWALALLAKLGAVSLPKRSSVRANGPMLPRIDSSPGREPTPVSNAPSETEMHCALTAPPSC
jgi:fatty-acid desaturase